MVERRAAIVLPEHLDAFYTPKWVVRQCMELVLPKVLDGVHPGCVLEPGCGRGAVVAGLRETYGDAPRILALDIDSRVLPCSGATWNVRANFLQPFDVPRVGQDSLNLGRFDLSVGNPPYTLAEAFVRRSIELARQTVFLLRSGFLASAEREPLFRDHRPLAVWMLANRPDFTGGGGDKYDYCWVAWRAGFDGSTVLSWLPAVPLSIRREG
jgi:hypothetical protein